jgi:hypothetical protein
MANTPLLACSARFNAWAYRGVSKRGTCVKLEAGAKGAPSHRPYRVTKPVSRVLYRAAKRGDGHSSRASLAARLLQPTRAAHLKADWKRSPASAPPLFGLAPGGVCRAVSVTKDAVRSYRTLSPLPRNAVSDVARRFAFCCTVPGVTPAGGYPAPCFLGARTFLSAVHAILEAKRPSGLLTGVIRDFGEVPSSSRALDYRAFPRRWLPARNGILIASLAPVPIPYLCGPAVPGPPLLGFSSRRDLRGAVGAKWCIANAQSRFDLALACDLSRSDGAR